MKDASLHPLHQQALAARHPAHEVLPSLVARWSPRAMSGEAVSDEELMRLFEAARWAPSSNNTQPWRFVYAKAGGPHWGAFFDLLSDGNKRWVGCGAVLVVMASIGQDARTGRVLKSRSFDCGASWQNLALQGSAMGLVVHAMQGFDFDKATTLLRLPVGVQVEAMCVVGRPGAPEVLVPELQARESPSPRNPVAEFAFEGFYPVAP